MKLLHTLLLTASFVCGLSFASPANYTYPTKFGTLKFMLPDGKPGEPAQSIILNDEVLLSSEDEVDKQGELLFLMSESQTTTSREKLPRRPGETGKTGTTRMVVLVGQGNCTKKLVVLDFTGFKPLVSDKFGNDHDERLCLTFKKAKWGKKESEITLTNGATYIYSATGKVSGPFVLE